MTFKIVTDSCCNLPEDIIDDLDLTIFPLVFMIGEEQHQSYLKGEVTDLQQFYTHMREGKVFTTSLPNLKDAEADLKAIFESGNDVLYLGFSSALSGTYEAINLLGNDLVKNYPDRTFIAIDTLAASLGQGLLVTTLRRCAQKARPSTKLPAGYARTCYTCATGSRWTTSCSSTVAGAFREQQRSLAAC